MADRSSVGKLTDGQKALVRNVTKEAMREIVTVFLVIYFIAWVLTGIANAFDVGRDSTDYKGKRSGMEIKQDALTGCEYLMGSRGGLTPRLDREGNHICGSPDPRFTSTGKAE